MHTMWRDTDLQSQASQSRTAEAVRFNFWRDSLGPLLFLHADSACNLILIGAYGRQICMLLP